MAKEINYEYGLDICNHRGATTGSGASVFQDCRQMQHHRQAE